MRSPAERERHHRLWVANGGPARAAALRRAREAGTERSYLRAHPLDPKLARLSQRSQSDPKPRAKDGKVAQKRRQAELRKRACTLLWISDQKAIARARRRVAAIRNRATAFRLFGNPDA